jgi:hypothetical protein
MSIISVLIVVLLILVILAFAGVLPTGGFPSAGAGGLLTLIVLVLVGRI